ncbi:MAG: hypothetical protein A3C06_04600 [Candidatus Taylorbacteria bacterium RIFCSPHIGHO2_02_FULL_46_13]|uniref:Uncharacterized protein n=1 Tax=Candidatus Taylorbacteria bacterium RIFCSPHIGHO2_02_FULL_46_13 TaxID=1802312 RepID=A0A1G2MQS6_9BACT|nr:MAG: hypothetical protein A3C06_04600 [Candidatus Taylorbacteria bacterium RIFCSPHIGHO2_02_FULL_46_13]
MPVIALRCGMPQGLTTPNLPTKHTLKKPLLTQEDNQPLLAAKLCLTLGRIQTVCDKVKVDKRAQMAHAEMVALTCSFCNGTIYRPKWYVEMEKRKHPQKNTVFCNRRCYGNYRNIHSQGNGANGT